MADKYHISPTTGNPNRCYASTRPCPVGGEGDHYPTKEAAREAYEKRMESSQGNVIPLKKKQASPPKTEEAFKNALKHSGIIKGTLQYTASEMKALEKVGDGRPVKAELLDSMIHKTEDHLRETTYVNATTVATAQGLREHLQAVRAQDPTPSTLTTAWTFDPSQETTFSNPQARKNGALAAKAMKREEAHGDWMRQRAAEDYEAALGVSDAHEGELLRAASTEYERQADKSTARLNAQMEEMQFLYDQGDLAFRRTLPLGVQASLAKGEWRKSPVDAPVDHHVISTTKLK